MQASLVASLGRGPTWHAVLHPHPSDCTPRQCMVADTLASMNGPVNCARTRQREGSGRCCSQFQEVCQMRLEAEEATRAEHLASRKSLAGQRRLGTVEKDSPCAGMCLGYSWRPAREEWRHGGLPWDLDAW